MPTKSDGRLYHSLWFIGWRTGQNITLLSHCYLMLWSPCCSLFFYIFWVWRFSLLVLLQSITDMHASPQCCSVAACWDWFLCLFSFSSILFQASLDLSVFLPFLLCGSRFPLTPSLNFTLSLLLLVPSYLWSPLLLPSKVIFSWVFLVENNFDGRAKVTV